MIKIAVIIPQNDVKPISDALKKINVGGITILKVKGRGKTIAEKLHSSKGTEMYTPALNIIRANSKNGKDLYLANCTCN